MGDSFISGAIYVDLFATIKRTFYAFAIATVIGVPLGVILGSNEKIYRSVEFLIDFFRSTPSSALIPLFMLIFLLSIYFTLIIDASVIISTALSYLMLG